MKKIYGIVGYPVAQSLSPAMHQAAFKAEGIDAEYRLFEIDPKNPEDLENFCYETVVNGIVGFSVTMPYKETMMQFMDYYDPLSKKIGCLNTVADEDGNMIGYNTDATGAVAALREAMEVRDAKVLVMGTGGAARAISYALKGFGAEVWVFGRDWDKARALAEEFELDLVKLEEVAKEEFDIIVNATPVGSGEHTGETLLNATQIKKGAVVMDIVTNPIETQLLREAKKAGAKAISGERMLLHQAAGQFEAWFGKTAPLKAMEEALYAELKKRG